MTDDPLTAGVHTDYMAQAEQLGGRLRVCADAEVSFLLRDHTQSAARERDDNHVGTEHVILGLYRSPNAARVVLEGCGVTREIFGSVLDDEPGPSPAGTIPFTVRAIMIGVFAVLEADRRGSSEVGVLHLLLGAIQESRRWGEQHAWGPHHLQAAAQAAGSSLAAIEQETARVLRT